MNTTRRYSAEVLERAVRMVLDHERDYESQCGAEYVLATNGTQARIGDHKGRIVGGSKGIVGGSKG